MNTEKTLDEVRKVFAGDRFATENGAHIEAVGRQYAKCSLNITDRHRNAMGAVMGGVYFMLADFTFAVAANWETMGTVSLHADIVYLGAARGNKLSAEAVCLKEGRSTGVYRVEIKDEQENPAAVVTVTGFHKQ